MTDRELLELAAKAAGYEVLWVDHEWIGGRDHIKQMLPEKYQHFIIGKNKKWNPLEDDGDALRLAVDLGLQFYGREIGASVDGYEFVDEADCRGDKYLAARRAIVLAAAEIGRNMP